MATIILFIVLLIVLITFYATSLTGTKPNESRLLGTTFPKYVLEDKEISDIMKAYKKKNNLFFLGAFIATFPILLFGALPSLSIIYMFLWIGGLLLGFQMIFKKTNQQLVSLKTANHWTVKDPKDLSGEDVDTYWKNGFYNNPKDKRLLVEKRIGYGMTMNMGRPAGKIVTYGILGSVVVLMLALSIMFVQLDATQIKMVVTESTVTMDVPFYKYTFNVSDIQEVSLVETLPSGIRTNGASTSRYNLGNFNLNGYGKTKMYVYNNKPPYIVIQLPDSVVIVNQKTVEETQVYYEALRN